jgi:hypothetical protein
MIASDFAVLGVRCNAEIESARRFTQAPNFQGADLSADFAD